MIADRQNETTETSHTAAWNQGSKVIMSFAHHGKEIRGEPITKTFTKII